ncbi:Acidic 27 kDa endochitinase [Dendrobium catenatum]|uniref:chitinase n=1 Tax=Dendrobium catenatum TaxID=906689 RepID=A0A2I0VA34_9ASPA|nr:Acidic 27 kDa endochitinase [Dendrobium catenatum]
MFEEMLKHRGDLRCPGSFYTYEAFIAAAEAFPGFGTTGLPATCRRELAAFFGQTSHETRGTTTNARVPYIIQFHIFHVFINFIITIPKN